MKNLQNPPMKMIAYNTEWLRNRYVRGQAAEAFENDCISNDDYQRICTQLPSGFVTHNIYMRFGYAFLTFLVIIFSSGLFGVILNLFNNVSASLILGGLVYYALLELLVINRLNHYNSGADNVLTTLSVTMLISGICSLLYKYNDPSYLAIGFLSFFILLAMAIRLCDSILSMAASIAWLWVVFFACNKLGAFGKAIVPFVLMIASGALWFVSSRLAKAPKLVLYRLSLQCVSIVALLAMYAAGNYYLVKKVGAEMFGMDIFQKMPVGWFFWTWTILLPFAYIIAGIMKKNAILLRTGLVLIAVAVATFRYYYHLLSPEAALVLAGTVLILTAYGFMKYLKKPKHGFTLNSEYQSENSNMARFLADQVIGKTISNSEQPKNNGDGW